MTGRREDLRDALARHLPADAEEGQAVSAILELMVTAPDPFAGDRYDPGHITASGFVVHPREAKVALVVHRKLGRWLQPGGHVEVADASLAAAAAREVAEETGLEGLQPLGLLDVDVHPYPAWGETPPHLHFDVRWAFSVSNPTLGGGEGVSHAAWVPLDEVIGWGDRSLSRPASRLAGNLRGR